VYNFVIIIIILATTVIIMVSVVTKPIFTLAAAVSMSMIMIIKNF